jgi:hypothetical protein
MATQHERLSTLLSQFKSVDKRLLISRTEWGAIVFNAAAKDIDSIYEIVDLLSDLPTDRLPTSAANQISESLERVWHWIQKNNVFSLNDGNPTATRDEIVNNLAVQQQDLYVNTHNWIPFLAYLKGDIPQQLRQITTSVAQARSQTDDFSSYLSTQRAELDGIIKATREAAAEAGVGVFTEDFETDAAERESESNSWLTRASIGAGITIAVAIGLFFIAPPENQYALVQYTTSKIVILAMLIGITAWCASNFKANKHQATVSRHKAHALKTFQAFVQASDNPAVKDAVLMETTRAIFSHSPTGYLKGDVATESPSRVVEIMKGTSDS